MAKRSNILNRVIFSSASFAGFRLATDKKMEYIMKKQTIWVLTALMFIFFAFSAQAGTRDDCITKCKEAVQYYQKWGKDAAIEEIGNKTGKFVWNDRVSYVFMMDMNAMMMAHPHKPQPKHTFVYCIPDTDYFVASGFYVIKAGVYR